jgi:OOP family OmpA-OmpF porin
MTTLLSLITSSLLVAEPSSAPATGGSAESGAEASASLDVGAKGKKTKKAKKTKKSKAPKTSEAPVAEDGETTAAASQVPWIRRWAPQRNMVEVGVMGGVYMPGKRLELFEATFDLPDQGFRRYSTLGPELGGRISYLPLRMLAVEVEGAVMPTHTDNGLDATIWSARGGLLGQLPYWSTTPFLVVGAGLLGVVSERAAVGRDIDPTLYFGGGLKIYLSRQIQLRLDARDVVSHKRSVSDTFQNHNLEALLSFTLTFNRPKPVVVPPPPDTDRDGILDSEDKCVDVPGVAKYQGCPIPDTDKDGILDPDDKCIDVAGVAEYDGCPIPDTDGDGILDPDDDCIDVAGVAEYEGCPIPDTDGDGILDPDDDCKNDPETTNGFEDGDGCPDEVPKEVQRFNGIIKGIQFDTNKATIRPSSRTTLDETADVLAKYPSVQVEIIGHTDDRGERESNLELSQNRANSVRDYLVGKGIDASRIRTRGAGPDEPVAPNKTKAGRAQNRRIEFKIVQR